AFGAAETIKMRELCRDPAQIVPYPAQDCIDLGRRFFREGGAEIIAADAVFAQARSNEAEKSRGGIADALAVEPPDQSQSTRDQPPGDRIGRRFQRDSDPSATTSKAGLHCSDVVATAQ